MIWKSFHKRLFLKLSLLKKNLLTIMLTIVNEGSSLMIVNETANFITTDVFGKTVVFEKKITCTFTECCPT